LEPTTSPGSHAGLKLFSLGLQHCRSKECHLFTLLYAAQDLGVVEIADSYANQAWRVFAVRLHEHEHRAASPAGCSRAATRCAATTATTAATAPASR